MGDYNSSNSITQHLDEKGVCFCNVFLSSLGGTADTSSTPDAVPTAQASNSANRGDRTFTLTRYFCRNSRVAMEHTTTVSPHRKGVSARYGQHFTIQKECTPTGGKNTAAEATATSCPEKPLSLRRGFLCDSPDYATLDGRGRRFYYGWGLTGCTASRNRQCKTQSKSRGYLRNHACDSIGDKATNHVCGVHLRR